MSSLLSGAFSCGVIRNYSVSITKYLRIIRKDYRLEKMNDQTSFDVLTSVNKEVLANEGKYCQVWGIVITKLTVIGNLKTIGIAINENLIMNLVLPEEHPFLIDIRDMGDEVIGK